MVWIDILILFLILWFSYKGFKNGIIVELTTFIALILAIWGALKYRELTTDLIQRTFNIEGDYLPFLSFAITFIIILLIITFIGKIITSIFNIVQLGILNRTLGFLFGMMKISVILALLINGFNRINQKREIVEQKTINNSYFYLPLDAFADKIYQFSDEYFDEIKDTFDQTIDDIDSTTI